MVADKGTDFKQPPRRHRARISGGAAESGGKFVCHAEGMLIDRGALHLLPLTPRFLGPSGPLSPFHRPGRWCTQPILACTTAEPAASPIAEGGVAFDGSRPRQLYWKVPKAQFAPISQPCARYVSGTERISRCIARAASAAGLPPWLRWRFVGRCLASRPSRPLPLSRLQTRPSKGRTAGWPPA